MMSDTAQDSFLIPFLNINVSRSHNNSITRTYWWLTVCTTLPFGAKFYISVWHYLFVVLCQISSLLLSRLRSRGVARNLIWVGIHWSLARYRICPG